MLEEVARLHRTSDPDEIFRLGELAEAFAELLGQDAAAHGTLDLFGQLLSRRLEAYGVVIRCGERGGGCRYDHAAFREYLRVQPRGPRAADARFKILADRFYGEGAPDPTERGPDARRPVLEAIAEEERFVKEHPAHERAGQVRFFLAVHYFRASRLLAGAPHVEEYERRARRELEGVRARAPDSAEARAATVLLERLADPARRR